MQKKKQYLPDKEEAHVQREIAKFKKEIDDFLKWESQLDDVKTMETKINQLISDLKKEYDFWDDQEKDELIKKRAKTS